MVQRGHVGNLAPSLEFVLGEVGLPFGDEVIESHVVGEVAFVVEDIVDVVEGCEHHAVCIAPFGSETFLHDGIGALRTGVGNHLTGLLVDDGAFGGPFIIALHGLQHLDDACLGGYLIRNGVCGNAFLRVVPIVHGLRRSLLWHERTGECGKRERAAGSQ